MTAIAYRKWGKHLIVGIIVIFFVIFLLAVRKDYLTPSLLNRDLPFRDEGELSVNIGDDVRKIKDRVIVVSGDQGAGDQIIYVSYSIFELR